MNINRQDGECLEQYLYRLGGYKSSGLIDMTWDDIAQIINDQCGADKSPDVCRKEYAIARRYASQVFGRGTPGDSEMRAEVAKRQAQTINIETNRWIREHARDDLITEKIVDAIHSLEPLEMPQYIETPYGSRVGMLCMGDAHFGTEFIIYGLNGEVLNEYNEDVFRQRMFKLLHETVRIVEENGLSDLYVSDLGDFADGILRVSQLVKLQYGVVESTVRYADFISTWLNELTKVVRVHFGMVDGNHTELRMLGQPKSTFKDENMGIVVRAFIKERLKDNPNFEFIENKTGYIFQKIYGYTILCIHGDEARGNNSVKDFSNTYGVRINYLIAGHNHHSRLEEVGMDVESIGVPSIIGIDNYSMSLNAVSNPGATLLLLEEGKGKTVQYTIKL